VLHRHYQNPAQNLEISEDLRGNALRKFRTLKKRTAQDPDAAFTRLNLAANFTGEGTDGDGVKGHPCIDSGARVRGRTVRAKDTLYMSYLPIACNTGNDILTQVRVLYLTAPSSLRALVGRCSAYRLPMAPAGRFPVQTFQLAAEH
jgi:hypothetical protein